MIDQDLQQHLVQRIVNRMARIEVARDESKRLWALRTRARVLMVLAFVVLICATAASAIMGELWWQRMASIALYGWMLWRNMAAADAWRSSHAQWGKELDALDVEIDLLKYVEHRGDPQHVH